MKAIFKITSKKITKLVHKELKRKNGYMTTIHKRVKKFDSNVLGVTHFESSWDDSYTPPRGVKEILISTYNKTFARKQY